MCLKKLLLPGLVSLLLFNDLGAQQSRFSMAATFGAAFPVGKFAGKKFADSSQSLAIMGPVLNLQLNYRICSHFGAGLLLSGQENGVDATSIERQIENSNPNTSAYVSSGSWMIGKIMAGPTLSLPVKNSEKWNFTARLMVGALKTAEPKLYIATESFVAGGSGFVLGSGSAGAATQFASSQSKWRAPWSLAYLAGTGVSYAINERWRWRADLDYCAARVKMPVNYSRHFASPSGIGYGYTLLSGNNTVLPTPGINPNFSLPVSSLNISTGLEFRF